MNKQLRTWSLMSLLTMIASPAFAQKEKEKGDSPQEIVVQVIAKDSDSTKGQDSKDEKKSVSVTVVDANGSSKEEVIQKLIKELSGTSMGEEQKAKILDSIKKALSEKHGTEGGKKSIRLELHSDKDSTDPNAPKRVAGTKIELREGSKINVNESSDGEVVLLDKDGKQQRIQLRNFHVATPQAGRAIAIGQDGKVEIKLQIEDKVKQKVKAALKENGVDDKVVESVLKGLDGIDASVEGTKVVPGMKLPMLNRGKLGEKAIEWSQAESAPRYVIGVLLDPSEEDADEAEGMRVQSVFEESPAAVAGIKEEDVLRKVDGKPVKEAQDLIAVVQEAGKANRTVKILIDRDGKEKEIEIKPKKESSATFTFSGTDLQSLEKLPEDLKKSFEGLSGQMRGFVLPPNAKGVEAVLGHRLGSGEGLDELKDEIDDLKDEIKELKAMIKSLKSGKE